MDIENRLDGIAWASKYAKKALKNKDTHRLRLALTVIKTVCEEILSKIDREFPLDKHE